MVSGQGKSRACFATLAERKTRFYIAVKMPDRRAETMENAIVAALSALLCRSCHAKTKPGVDKRQVSQSSELPFSPGAMDI